MRSCVGLKVMINSSLLHFGYWPLGMCRVTVFHFVTCRVIAYPLGFVGHLASVHLVLVTYSHKVCVTVIASCVKPRNIYKITTSELQMVLLILFFCEKHYQSTYSR